ncbi:MAG: branched-chain amino acid ABC transporter permease [Thermodesulfobacteriota bacterium]
MFRLLRNSKGWLLAVVLLILLVFPRFASGYHTYLMLTFFAYAIILLGLNLLLGYTGLLSFGYALYVGIGAYTATFLMSKFSIMSMEVIIVISIMISAILGSLMGILCVRYVKIYFAMLTLAFSSLFHSLILKTYRISGADEGLHVLRPYLLGFNQTEIPKMEFLAGSFYYYNLAVAVIATFIMWRIVSSHFGLCLKSIRENPEKAKYLGINIIKCREYAFILSSVYGAVGGALLASITGHVDSSVVYWTHSGSLVFMALLGGFQSFFGPLIGAVVYIYLQDTVMSITQYWRIIFGIILAFIVIVAPGGLIGVMEYFMKRFRDIKGAN